VILSLTALQPGDPNWLPAFLTCWNDPNCDEAAMLKAAMSEPNAPQDPNWVEVRAPALQSFCDNWLKRTRIECLDYTARPPVFVLADDPNLWRLVQTGIERHIIWRYDPNGIRVKDCWIRRNVYDRNGDGIVIEDGQVVAEGNNKTLSEK